MLALRDINLSVRPATAGDIDWMDQLQRPVTRELGFMFRKTFEGKVDHGEVLIGEIAGERVGYVIASNHYRKREDTGIVYQMNIAPEHRRSLVAATLLKALFDSWPRGVKLCCCWCAQDLAANEFWEAMGFVPLAYRGGSENTGKAGRVHIFWMKRLYGEDDAGAGVAAWWFPSKTDGGSIAADRVVFPIPLDQHWSDARPVVFNDGTVRDDATKALQIERGQESPVKLLSIGEESATATPDPLPETVEEVVKKDDVPQYADGVESKGGELWKDGKRLMTAAMAQQQFGDAGGMFWQVPAGVEIVDDLPEPKKRRRKVKRAKKSLAKKADPRLVAFARDLRDAWLEQINAQPGLLAGEAKHDVNRLPGPAIRMMGSDATPPGLPMPTRDGQKRLAA